MLLVTQDNSFVLNFLVFHQESGPFIVDVIFNGKIDYFIIIDFLNDLFFCDYVLIKFSICSPFLLFCFVADNPLLKFICPAVTWAEKQSTE